MTERQENRFVVCCAGLPKHGKTHLGFTAPEPIFFFNLDRGTEGVIDKFEGKEIYYEDYLIPSKVSEKTKADELDRFVGDYFSTIKAEKEGTIFIDSFTQE